MLGHYDDPIYGAAKLDFLAEFRYLNSDFPSTAKATSVQVVLYYKTFFGDSTAVQEAAVYQLNKPLLFEENYTSDINVEEFCDKSVVLGKKVYVAYDPTIPDSLKEEPDFCNTVKVDLPIAMAETLIADRSLTQSQSNFLNFIKIAKNTKFITRNYVYAYTKKRMKTVQDELRVIEKAQIMDMEILGSILAKYVMKGMTKSSVWAEGIRYGVFYKVVAKMKELIEFWTVPM